MLVLIQIEPHKLAGDSGGPTYVERGGKQHVIGVTHGGSSCGDNPKDGYFFYNTDIYEELADLEDLIARCARKARIEI